VARQAGAVAGRQKNPFHSVTIGDGAKQQVIGVSGPQFALLARAAGTGCKLVKGGNEKDLGVLHRLGLVRFSFSDDDGWPYAVAVLTPAGAQALAQEPFGHAKATTGG